MTSDNTANGRALASRRNGARSRGPRTAAGWARTARNALKQDGNGPRALLDDEDASEFRAFQAALGLGLMRDGNGPRTLETLVRYRGSVLAELFRALAALKLLQAQARVTSPRTLRPMPRRRSCRPAPRPNEPEKAQQNKALAFEPGHDSGHTKCGRLGAVPAVWPWLEVTLAHPMGREAFVENSRVLANQSRRKHLDKTSTR
jgi:hypothetical protein